MSVEKHQWALDLALKEGKKTHNTGNQTKGQFFKGGQWIFQQKFMRARDVKYQLIQ